MRKNVKQPNYPILGDRNTMEQSAAIAMKALEMCKRLTV